MYYKGGQNIPSKALRQEENKLVGDFFYYLKNVGVNDGRIRPIVLVAEHYKKPWPGLLFVSSGQ